MMHELVVLKQCREDKDGTEIRAVIPEKHIAEMLVRKKISKAEIRFDDGRHISAEQRKRHMRPSVILLIIPVIHRKK